MPAAPEFDPAPTIGVERRYQLLVDAVSYYAICMLDVESRIASWNPGAQRMTGYAPAEIIGQPFARFFTAPEQAEAMRQQALLQGRSERELWLQRKNRSTFLGLVVVEAIRDERGNLLGFAAITRDITERQAAQQALLEAERRFRLLVEGITDYAIYMLDPSGMVTNWNTGAERLKGYRADEIVGQHFSRFYSGEDRAAGLPQRALDAAIGNGRFEAETWHLRKDGSRFWASFTIEAIRDRGGTLIGFAKITRDITERRVAQEALRDSERLFRLLVAGVTDYALYMLDPNGVITSWNAGAARIKGYAADEVIGQHFSRFYTEVERTAGRPAQALASALRDGRFEAEGWRVRKDGTMFWASVVIDVVRDEQGQLVGFAKITRDITERREAALALQKANEQLARSQKMEALGQLTGGVAHDFNNLLMIVSGNAATLRDRLAHDPVGSRAAESIERAARRGERLTRHLLTFSRRQALSPTTIELSRHLASFREMLASSLPKHLELVFAIAPEAWPIEIDVSELELALVNIAVNARDAMPEGGRLTISAENVRVRRGELSSDIEGEFVALTLADTGSGIPEDILPRIFDPFFTTKQGDKGTGLGLSQVYGFVHQSGGTVTVTSRIGEGTRVTLYLPRAKASPASAERDVPAARPVPGGRILVVEDNPEVAEVSAALLHQLGYATRVAPNAEEALELIRKGEAFELVFSDIVMTGKMDGIALARAVRELRPGLPVLLSTGYAKAAEMAQGEFTILRKPYQIATLGRMVGSFIAAARRRPEAPNLVHLHDRKPREEKPA